MSRNGAELLYRILHPYVDELVKTAVTGHATIEEPTFKSLVELICFQAEQTVRRMVRTLNRKMRAGELEELRRLIRENPEAARKAAKYVARRLKHRVRRMIEEELGRAVNGF
jgi:hypothetical protein